MKALTYILTMVFTVVITTSLYSQHKQDTIKLWTIYPGYVIDKSNDTIHGYLLLKNKISNQGTVFFFNSPTDAEPAQKYRPKEIKGYKVANRFYETVKHSPEFTTMRYSFLLKKVEGPVSLYASYYDNKKRIEVNENDIWRSKIDLSFSEDELVEKLYGSRNGGELEDFSLLIKPLSPSGGPPY